MLVGIKQAMGLLTCGVLHLLLKRLLPSGNTRPRSTRLTEKYTLEFEMTGKESSPMEVYRPVDEAGMSAAEEKALGTSSEMNERRGDSQIKTLVFFVLSRPRMSAKNDTCRAQARDTFVIWVTFLKVFVCAPPLAGHLPSWGKGRTRALQAINQHVLITDLSPNLTRASGV